MGHERDAHLPLKVLDHLPLDGNGATVRELMKKLGLEDNRTVERRIQRQLERLCDAEDARVERVQYRLDSDHVRAIRYRRSPVRSATSGLPRSKRLQVAIQAKLVLDHLRPVLPFELSDALTTNLKESELAFDQLRRARQIVWTDRIRVVPAGHPLKAPEIAPAVQHEVETAIDRGRQLRFGYQRGPDDRARELTCHPLGLLFRPPVLYLVARDARGALRQYALHRMTEAEALAAPADLANFDFDAFLASGSADIPWSGQPRRILIAAKAAFARIWDGTPLGDDQKITKTDDPDYPWRIAATVPDTHLLRGYLLSLGTEAIVLEPRDIANWMVEEATSMAADIRSRLKGSESIRLSNE